MSSALALPVSWILLTLASAILAKHPWPEEVPVAARRVIGHPWVGPLLVLPALLVALLHARRRHPGLYLLGALLLLAAFVAVVGSFLALLVPLYQPREL